MEVLETIKIPHCEITKKLGIFKVWKELERLAVKKPGELRLLNNDKEWIEIARPRINAMYYAHLGSKGTVDKIIIW